MDEIAIKVDSVSKDFQLPHERNTSVKQAFVNPFRSAMHKNTTHQHALKNVSFEVKKGEFFGIVGRNGSGKSTLLKLLAGIYQPTKGSIKTKGKLVPFIELGVGFNPELTGRQNVFLNGALLGFSNKEVQVMYEDIVAFAELKDFMDQKLKNYSSGMQVRLAFSMAVRAKADILLIDEVLAVGDADFQRKCFDYFKNLKKENITVVFVSHDMDAVREYCDRSALIENSKLVTVGPSNKVAAQYTKLFSESQKLDDSKVSSKRWGELTGIISAARMPRSITAEDKQLDLKVAIRSQEDLQNPIVGFVLKNSAGKNIIGANTKLLKVNTGYHSAGTSWQVSFSLPNLFSDGSYTVDAAVTDSSGVTVLDWWEDVARFKVYKDSHSPYPVSPDIQVKVEKE